MNSVDRVGASFRDPGGFVFECDGELLRQINSSSQSDFEQLSASGLYRILVDLGRLIPHEEVDRPLAEKRHGWKIIRPRRLAFISYPYEWCFSQLKDAALATLEIQKLAMEHGMSLKDASAYNIQFDNGRPLLIDTLSFERYEEGKPWAAYRQMCQHFLAPLALMALRNIELSQLLRVHLDGIPLDLASSLLPVSSRLSLGLGTHVHLHARMSQKHAGTAATPSSVRSLGRTQFLGIIDSIESTIRKLNWEPRESAWSAYYGQTNYSEAGMQDKRRLVAEFIDLAQSATVWDLGSNTGQFSRLASERGAATVSLDADPAAVEANYLEVRSKGEKNVLPLLMDLTNLSPALGWNQNERMGLMQRGPADLTLALALVHHLAIAHNLPLGHIARFLSRIGRRLVIEFVPKDDSQTQRLLASRPDIFPDYTQQAFECEFSRCFEIERKEAIAQTKRTLYLMRRREEP